MDSDKFNRAKQISDNIRALREGINGKQHLKHVRTLHIYTEREGDSSFDHRTIKLEELQFSTREMNGLILAVNEKLQKKLEEAEKEFEEI